MVCLNKVGLCHSEFPPIGLASWSYSAGVYSFVSSEADRTALDQGAPVSGEVPFYVMHPGHISRRAFIASPIRPGLREGLTTTPALKSVSSSGDFRFSPYWYR